MVNGLFPLRLQLGKSLLTEVTCIAPVVSELVQAADVQLPVGVLGMRLAPSPQRFDHRQTVAAVFNGFLLEFVQPFLNNFISLVASRIETLPQRMVRHAALVGLLPLLTQLAQILLHLAPTHGGHFLGLGRRGCRGHSLWDGRTVRNALNLSVRQIGLRFSLLMCSDCGLRLRD